MENGLKILAAIFGKIDCILRGAIYKRRLRGMGRDVFDLRFQDPGSGVLPEQRGIVFLRFCSRQPCGN